MWLKREDLAHTGAHKINNAIGQGLLSATPLQLASAYGTLANYGFKYRPTIIKAIWEPGVPDGDLVRRVAADKVTTTTSDAGNAAAQISRYRAAHGLGPVKVDPLLSGAAETHARAVAEAANLSQQLAVLRRAGLVTTRKEGSSVYYSLVSPQIAELMAVARSIPPSALRSPVSTCAT